MKLSQSEACHKYNSPFFLQLECCLKFSLMLLLFSRVCGQRENMYQEENEEENRSCGKLRSDPGHCIHHFINVPLILVPL